MNPEFHKKFNITCRGIIVNSGELLVVQHKPDREFLALPGGHLEHGEDVIECIERELSEELGIQPEIGRLQYIHTYVDDDKHQRMEFFFHILNGEDYYDLEGTNPTHDHEINKILWLKPSDQVLLRPQQLLIDFKDGTLISDSVSYINNL